MIRRCCVTLPMCYCVNLSILFVAVLLSKKPSNCSAFGFISPRWGVLQMRLLFLAAFVLQAALRVVVAAFVANKLLSQVANCRQQLCCCHWA